MNSMYLSVSLQILCNLLNSHELRYIPKRRNKKILAEVRQNKFH